MVGNNGLNTAMPVEHSPWPQRKILWKWGAGEPHGLVLPPGRKLFHGDNAANGKTRLELDHRKAMANRRARRKVKPTIFKLIGPFCLILILNLRPYPGGKRHRCGFTLESAVICDVYRPCEKIREYCNAATIWRSYPRVFRITYGGSAEQLMCSCRAFVSYYLRRKCGPDDVLA